MTAPLQTKAEAADAQLAAIEAAIAKLTERLADSDTPIKVHRKLFTERKGLMRQRRALIAEWKAEKRFGGTPAVRA